MPDRRMTLCNRLIARAVNGLSEAFDVIAPFWQTPREVEWAKAAADGLAEREAEEEVAESCSHFCPDCGPRDAEDVERCNYLRCRALAFSPPWLMPKTSAPTPGAVDGPAEGEPPEPSAGVGKFGPDYLATTESLFGRYPPIADVPGLRWRDCAPSAEVEPPASAPSAESPAPEFDWVTTAIPVIAGVLSEHVPSPQCNYILCLNVRRETCGEFDNWADWRAHVAPHIAVDVQSDCTTTTYDFPSGDRPRPLADFPKHQK